MAAEAEIIRYFILGCSGSIYRVGDVDAKAKCQYKPKQKMSEERNVRVFWRNVRMEKAAAAAFTKKKKQNDVKG